MRRCPRCGDPLTAEACRRCGPLPPPNGSTSLLAGLAALPEGAFFLCRRPRLWPLAVAPALLTLLFFLGLAYGALRFGASLQAGLATADWGWLAFLQEPLAAALPWIAAALVLLVGFFLFVPVCLAVSAPFLDRLAGRVDAELFPGPAPGESFFRSLRAAAGDALRWALLNGLFLLGALPLHLLPLLGTLAWWALGVTLTAFEFLDYPLARHRYPWQERWRFLRRHAAPAAGLGAGLFGLLAVPGLNLLVLPIGVAAAELLYARLQPKEV